MAHFHRLCLPSVSQSRILQITIYIYNKRVVGINKTRRNKKKLTKWPKRRRTRRLGPFSSSLPTPSRILSLRIYIYYKILVSIQKKQRYSPRAQTTRLASFGPVFIVPAQSIMYLVIRTYIYNRTFVSIKKKRRKMKKKTHLWARFRRWHLTRASVSRISQISIYIYNKT